LREAMDRFLAAVRLQGRNRLLYQGVCSQLANLAASVGDDHVAVTLLASASDIEEAVVADDLWLIGQKRLDLDAFIAAHGFHAPNVGDIASRSWREDPEPVRRLLDEVAKAPRPAKRRHKVREDRDAAAAALLASLPRSRRRLARILLRLAPATARSLQRTKSSFLIAQDVARAAIRGLGGELVAAGSLAREDDAFYLLVEELLQPSAGVGELVARRKAQYEASVKVTLPMTWTGQPEPQPLDTNEPPSTSELRGLGVSAGIVEGRVRVVRDPGEGSEVALDDVLVCHTTDPSWVSLMTLASALVIDIGGTASHGAIVARELGIPCVVGTGNGTRVLRTGERVRVDGAAGTVQRLGG
ncbi:MAG TPA: PEP-utilizing enzyme, partial [Nocardioides sp.]|nr:PEP-utilizing enzyme [Nocardioides sp.]